MGTAIILSKKFMYKNIKDLDNSVRHNFENSFHEYLAKDTPVQENSVQEPAKCALMKGNKGEIYLKIVTPILIIILRHYPVSIAIPS